MRHNSDPKCAFAFDQVRRLVNAHKRLHKSEGREMIAAVPFGSLSEGDASRDVDLLEIVRGWPEGANSYPHEFSSTADFLLPGKLRLILVNPEEFEKSINILHPLVLSIVESHNVLCDPRGIAKKLLKTAEKELTARVS